MASATRRFAIEPPALRQTGNTPAATCLAEFRRTIMSRAAFAIAQTTQGIISSGAPTVTRAGAASFARTKGSTYSVTSPVAFAWTGTGFGARLFDHDG